MSKKLSLCYTNYNRLDMIVESFMDIHDHPLIDEIVISDDHSDLNIYMALEGICNFYPKVKLYRNAENVDCYRNKKEAIRRAINPYVIIFDSDNKMGEDYLDKLKETDWKPDTILMPSWARPTFTYKEFSGMVIDKTNVASLMDRPFFSTMLNCMNCFVNRDEYLKVWDETVNPHTADSIYFNYCWLNAGNKIHVVDGLEYDHLIHSNSHYKLNNHKTGDFYNVVEQKIRNLK